MPDRLYANLGRSELRVFAAADPPPYRIRQDGREWVLADPNVSVWREETEERGSERAGKQRRH